MPWEITINPSVMTDQRDAMAVAVNEGLRLFMEDMKFEPKFDITPEQEKFFAGTAYAEGPAQDAAKGGNVGLGKLDPARWGSSDGKPSFKADTSVPETADRIYEDTSNSMPSVVNQLSSVPEQDTGRPVRDFAVNAINTAIGVATAVGGANTATGSMRLFSPPTGPKLATAVKPAISYPKLQQELDATGGRLLEKELAANGRITLGDKPKAYWHHLGGVQTQEALKNLGVKYDLGEAHARGEALYSDIGAYAREDTASFDAVSRAITTARTQRKLLNKTGLDPNVQQGDQFIISAYTARPDTPNERRPGNERVRLRYVLNPVSKENIIAAYSRDSDTGSFRQGSTTGKKEISYAEAYVIAKQTGRDVNEVLNENPVAIAPQVKAPIFGAGGVSALQPSINDAVKDKAWYNEIVVRPQIGDFYLQDTRPGDGALPPKLQQQMKRLRQAYKAAHGGSDDPFAAPTKSLPNSFNPGVR